jgi:hypothetical protein
MPPPSDSASLASSRKYLVIASATLLAWNLVGIDLSSFHSDLLGWLAAIPKGVVPVALVFAVGYLTFSLFRDLALVPTKFAPDSLQALDVAIHCLIAISAVASYFSRLRAYELMEAIHKAPTCLVFAALGWTVVIPSIFALLRSRAKNLNSGGLTILAAALVGGGVLAIWISVEIVGNLWPAWVGSWLGLGPSVLLVRGWRTR